MQTLTSSVKDNILIIEMNHKGNSFTIELLDDLYIEFEKAREQKNLCAIILTGKKLFSAGGDIFGMKEAIDGKTDVSTLVQNVISKAAKLILEIIDHPLPVIAAINRAAAGAGLSLAMACDHRIVSENTKFATAFGTLALIPDSGASVLFAERFGISTTLLTSSTGETISLELAKQRGAVEKIVKLEELMSIAMDIAKSYVNADRYTVARTKYLLNRSLHTRLVDQFPEEEREMKSMTERESFKERVIALVEQLNKK